MTTAPHAASQATQPGEESSLWQRAGVWLALVATLAMNAAAASLRLNGNTPGSISDRFEVFFTPAGYVFSIWSLIYAGLLALAVYQTFAHGPASARVAAITTPFLVSCAANVAWILAWQYEQFPLSMVCMLVLLGSLLTIYRTFEYDGPDISRAERWCVRRPLALYTAWVCVATLANLSVVVEAEQARPFDLGAETWAVLMLVLATVVGIVVGIERRDRVFLGVLAWAFVGIAVKNGEGSTMSYAACGALGIVAALFVNATLRAPHERARLGYAQAGM